MTEQLISQPPPERPIDDIPLDSPDMHFIGNYHHFTDSPYTTDQSAYIESIYEKYGEENVRVLPVMTDDGPVVIPKMYGIYVVAKKWAELNPDQ